MYDRAAWARQSIALLCARPIYLLRDQDRTLTSLKVKSRVTGSVFRITLLLFSETPIVQQYQLYS